jgi:hypothetical protein
MKNDRNVSKDLQYALGSLKGNLRVLEVNIPVEKQMEYFRFSETIRSEFFDEQLIDEQMEILSSAGSTSLEKKFALAFLAISGDVKAYRAIEAYNEIHSDDWSILSLMQAKITLETEFSDEKQVFISTGLGGKGNLLRFYAFFKSNRKKNFSDYQKELIEKEIPYFIQKQHGILEEIQIVNNYFTLLFLINLQADIRTMLEEAIDECNQFGNFIDKGFIITNVRVFTEEEIQNELMNTR